MQVANGVDGLIFSCYESFVNIVANLHITPIYLLGQVFYNLVIPKLIML